MTSDPTFPNSMAKVNAAMQDPLLVSEMKRRYPKFFNGGLNLRDGMRLSMRQAFMDHLELSLHNINRQLGGEVKEGVDPVPPKTNHNPSVSTKEEIDEKYKLKDLPSGARAQERDYPLEIPDSGRMLNQDGPEMREGAPQYKKRVTKGPTKPL